MRKEFTKSIIWCILIVLVMAAALALLIFEVFLIKDFIGRWTTSEVLIKIVVVVTTVLTGLILSQPCAKIIEKLNEKF